MGLDLIGTRFLLYARHTLGVSFARCATIGRQTMGATPLGLVENFRAFDLPLDSAAARGMLAEAGGYAEPFLRALGAEEVCSLDASSYEQASEVVDFNAPAPDRLKNRFTAVLDGGTLEHVFNFPQAVRNCME